jgi:hypothetical protein
MISHQSIYLSVCLHIRGNAYNDSMVTVGSGDYKITKNDYYRTTGVHSVFQGDITETTGTCTDAIPIN